MRENIVEEKSDSLDKFKASATQYPTGYESICIVQHFVNRCYTIKEALDNLHSRCRGCKKSLSCLN